MTDYLEAVAAQLADGGAAEFGLDETGTLEYLLHVCRDAAEGADRIAELLILDNDPDTAEVFSKMSAESVDFDRRLSLALANSGHEDAIGTKGTFRGKLYRWVLQIDKVIPEGYRGADHRRLLLHVARRGSDLVTKAYADAEGRPLGPDARKEVHRQAEAVRIANARIHKLAEKS